MVMPVAVIQVVLCHRQPTAAADLLELESEVCPVLDCLTGRLDLEWLHLGVADGGCDAVGEALVDSSPYGQLPGLDSGVLDTLEVARYVVDVRLPLLVVPDFAPQRAWLLKVEFGNLAQISPCTANEAFVFSNASLIVDRRVDGSFLASIGQRLDAALVVGTAPLGDECGRAIALEVVNGHDGCVDWELLVVDSETMAVGIRVREETRLEDGVGRWLDVWNEVRRRESSLFDLCEVVLRVLVENQSTDGAEWELGVWPDLGEIKDIVAEFLSLFRSHSLNVDRP